MTLITARRAAAPQRRVSTLLLIGLLTVALVASLAIVGAQLRRQLSPDLLSGLLVPTLDLDSTWDATLIPGLDAPMGMDMGPDGNLYVVNSGASEIVVLSPDGSVVDRWGTQGSGPGQFDLRIHPNDPDYTFGGVAVAPDGSVYVVDSGNLRVQQFDADRDLVRTWGGFGPEDGRFMQPLDVEVDEDGRVYVVDVQRADIQRFDAAGSFEQTIGSQGSGPGQLLDSVASWSLPEEDPVQDWYPFALAADGCAYISNPNLDRIYRLDVGQAEAPEATDVTSAPEPSSAPGSGQAFESSASASAAAANKTLVIDEIFPVPLTFDLPAGWRQSQLTRGHVQVEKPGASGDFTAFVTVVLPTGIYPDPCHLEDGPQPIGPSVDDLTEAMTHLAGFKASPVRDITIDGFEGTAFDLDEAVGIDLASCSNRDWLQQMTYDHGVSGDVREEDLGVGKGRGYSQRMAILDVDGTRVLLQTWTFSNTPFQDVEEAIHVLESIDFG